MQDMHNGLQWHASEEVKCHQKLKHAGRYVGIPAEQRTCNIIMCRGAIGKLSHVASLYHSRKSLQIQHLTSWVVRMLCCLCRVCSHVLRLFLCIFFFLVFFIILGCGIRMKWISVLPALHQSCPTPQFYKQWTTLYQVSRIYAMDRNSLKFYMLQTKDQRVVKSLFNLLMARNQLLSKYLLIFIIL